MSGLGHGDEGVGNDEFMFRMTNGQHRARRRPDHAFGDTAHQQVCHAAAAVWCR